VEKILTPEEIFRGDIPDYIPETSRTACQKHNLGETFYSVTHECPEGFCSWAYADIQKDIVDLYYDSPEYYNHWLKGKRVNYVSCTNGLAPVIFKIERISDE
jgi:uncharacterized repeat protein (TIGR04076 family)